jgi:hypothetical protein
MSLIDIISGAAGTLVGSITNATIDFRNSTNKTILVVMDSNRESHKIAAHGQATFSKANVGDAPTFYVKDEKGEQVIFSRKVGSIGLKSSLGWNGSSF